MNLIDTHSHLDLPDYRNDLDAVLARARDAGVCRIVCPGINLKSSRDCIELADKYPMIFSAVGIHPHDADEVTDSDLDALGELAVTGHKVIAIGEIGLDYYRNYSQKENQIKLFKNCLKLAKECDLPVILHNRNADEDFYKILSEYGACGIKGVMHCFSGDKRLLKEALALGMYISFAGNITFPKADLSREIAGMVPLEKLLLETDSPYITPVPDRGKRNEPAFVKYLPEIYSELFKLSSEDVARITTHNANELFKLGLEEKGELAYPIRNSLYLNITNRCTNKCTFCTRQDSNFVKGHNLSLEKEPDYDDIKTAMGDFTKYDEVVFCGYGEPTLRLDIVKEIAAYVKEKGKKVRLTTNGEGNLINKRDITPELKGLVDTVGVSLNAPDKKRFNDICCSVFGDDTFDAVIEFIKGCRAQNVSVEITCLDILDADGIEGCRKIAEKYDADFRLRHFNVVG